MCIALAPLLIALRASFVAYTNEPLPCSQFAARFTHLYLTGTMVSTDWFAGTNRAITSASVVFVTPLQDTCNDSLFHHPII